MIWIVLALLTILSLVTVSLVFGSSTYSSMPGSKEKQSILGEDELLMCNYDNNNKGIIQAKHKEAEELVRKANVSYNEQKNREATSQALLQAVECYEAIREQVKSAVVELNLAILAKARIRIEQERNAPDKLLEELKEYFDNALEWADWYLKKDIGRYEQDVPDYRKKFVKYNNGSK